MADISSWGQEFFSFDISPYLEERQYQPDRKSVV